MKAGYKHNSQLVANNSGSKALKVLENTALFEMWYQVLFPAPCRLPIPGILSRWRDRIDVFNLTAFRVVGLFFCRKLLVFGQIVE